MDNAAAVADLPGCLPSLQARWGALKQFALENGIGLGVGQYGGLRDEADTVTILADRDADYAIALAAGTIPAGETIDAFRPISPFGSSYHNYGAAVDPEIVSAPDGLSDDAVWAMLGAYAPAIGLVWGGGFTNPDQDHFQLAMSLTDAAAAYFAMTGQYIAGDADATDDSLAEDASSADGETLPPSYLGTVLAAAGIGFVLLLYHYQKGEPR